MKKVLAIVLALVLCVALLASCKTTDGGSSEEPKAPVTIKTVSMFGGTDPSAGAYSDVIEKFEADHDWITVEDTSTTADDAWKAQVRADFAAGNEPDVIMFFTGADAAEILAQTVPVETIKAEYPDYASNINAGAWSMVTESDGVIYSVPFRGFWEGIFVNEDLFTANNVALPTDWDKLEAAVTAFAATDIVPVAMGYDIPHYWIEHLILAYGGIEDHAFNPGADIDKVPQSWYDGLNAFTTLGKLGAFPENVATLSEFAAEASQLFKDKKAAMSVDGSWFAGGITDPDTTTVLAFPTAPGGKKDPTDIVAGFSSGFYITKKAWEDEAKREACVEFVNAATSSESIAAYCVVGGAPAAPIEFTEEQSASMTRPAKDGAEMAGQAKGANPAMDSWWKTESVQYVRDNCVKLIKGETTAEEVLAVAIPLNK